VDPLHRGTRGGHDKGRSKQHLIEHTFMLLLRLSLFPNAKVTQMAQRKPAAASTETHLYSPYSYGKGEGMSFAGNQIITEQTGRDFLEEP